MSLQKNYSGPARYQPPAAPPPPPPKKGGMHFGFKILIGCCGGCLVLSFIGLLAFNNFMNREDVKDFIGMIPNAEQHVGEELEWSSVRSFSESLTPLSNVVQGNFDSDEGEELFIYDHAGTATGIYELDGSFTPVQSKRRIEAFDMIGWDWDGDGIEEIVYTADFEGTEISRLNGEQVARFPSLVPMGRDITAGYNGDGKEDLLLYDPVSNEANVIQQDGLDIIKVKGDFGGIASCFAEVDGDENSEIVTYSLKGYEFISPDSLQQEEYWDIVDPQWAKDLNNDGLDELISLEKGILNPEDGYSDLMQWPADFEIGTIEMGLGMASVAVFKENADSEPLLAVLTTGVDYRLLMFKPDGELIYDQEFGLLSIPVGMIVLENNGNQRLVLVTINGIRAFP